MGRLTRILVFNTGSSSHKCALFEEQKEIWHQTVDSQKGIGGALDTLPPLPLDAIGHRIVHGGILYREPVHITEEVKEKIREFGEFAPLHQMANLEGIEIGENRFPYVPQYAVFDTAFHTTLERNAYVYPLPYELLAKGVRRYGFHGISFSYCTKRLEQLLQKGLQSLKIVICHLGAGASLCAIKNGKSFDTTMGMTPLDGLMMATRCGTIDPAIPLFLMRKNKMTIDEVDRMLNFDSGFLGLSGISDDIRIVMETASHGNERAKLALAIFLHQLKKCLGMMIASLEGIDVLVFTGGIGEHIAMIRQEACSAFSFLGLKLDTHRNGSHRTLEGELSWPDSRVRVFVIPTKEEQEIAHQISSIVQAEIKT